ncbi:transcription termination factor Rho [Terrabacter sp. 2RAF25]|uniref:transcription termination factor Rho n=1 Tax=Terrabacter sp. 2RAF25 TaxID=3232998 RepID=UPI003F9A68E0
MSETTTRPVSGLSAMKLDELKGVASSMGITGTTKMRKSDLVEAIKARQAGGSSAAATSTPPPASGGAKSDTSDGASPARTSRRASRPAGSAGNEQAEKNVEQAGSAEAAADQSGAAGERASTASSVSAGTADIADTADTTSAGRSSRGARVSRDDAAGTAGTADTTQAADGDDDGRRQRSRGQQERQSDRRDDRSARQQSDRQQDDRQPSDRQQSDRQQGSRAERQNDRAQQSDRQTDRGDRQQARQQDNRQQDNRQQDSRQQDNRQQDNRQQDSRQHDSRQHDNRQQDSRQQDNRQQDNRQQDHDNRQGDVRGQQQSHFDDDGGSRRSRNRQRSRDRKRGRGREGGQDWNDTDIQVGDDDVLVPVGGILDVLDNYAFVRTSGYLAGPNDVYVPLGMVKKNGLRKGDAVTGAVKALRDGEQPSGNVGRQKFNALVRLDTVNGTTPEEAAKRVEFGKLTPLYPQQRLRLETEPNVLTTRIIDLVAPIGKGQRGLIVAPAKAGKTMIMQTLANAITTNNPECHLMVVLVDERPEEVTDMQRAVKGEVISSTFDRPAEDHTTVAELAIERAKRLVELGHDVVVLLDSITKLGRAYNLAAPASGRILSGGVDSAALYPPKKFFGAARNIENGGSLTILATALVETGSKMDEVIFEEFKGTGNMELRLNRELANRRIFPAVDINSSGTRREEILLASEELKIMWKLRRVLAALDPQQAIELLIDRLKKTRTNYEFLTQVQQTSGSKLDES